MLILLLSHTRRPSIENPSLPYAQIDGEEIFVHGDETTYCDVVVASTKVGAVCCKKSELSDNNINNPRAKINFRQDFPSAPFFSIFPHRRNSKQKICWLESSRWNLWSAISMPRPYAECSHRWCSIIDEGRKKSAVSSLMELMAFMTVFGESFSSPSTQPCLSANEMAAEKKETSN